MAPAGISPWVPLCAVTITPSPILQCPATPTCPARMTFLPISVDPANPTWAHSVEFSRHQGSCARLGLDYRFWCCGRCGFIRLARSTHELAWISVVFNRTRRSAGSCTSFRFHLWRSRSRRADDDAIVQQHIVANLAAFRGRRRGNGEENFCRSLRRDKSPPAAASAALRQFPRPRRSPCKRR